MINNDLSPLGLHSMVASLIQFHCTLSTQSFLLTRFLLDTSNVCPSQEGSLGSGVPYDQLRMAWLGLLMKS